jgi:hypothetical protein
VQTFGDNSVFAGLQHPHTHNDGIRSTRQTSAGRSATGAGIQFDARTSLPQFPGNIGGRDRDVILIVSDQQMRDVIGNRRNEDLCVDGGDGFYASSDQLGALPELGFESRIILTQEPIHGRHQSDHFFLRHFQTATHGVGVGRIVQLGGFDQILAPQQQAGALRTAKALAARKGDQIKTICV